MTGVHLEEIDRWTDPLLMTGVHLEGVDLLIDLLLMIEVHLEETDRWIGHRWIGHRLTTWRIRVEEEVEIDLRLKMAE